MGLVCLVLALYPQQQCPSDPTWQRAVSKGREGPQAADLGNYGSPMGKLPRTW